MNADWDDLRIMLGVWRGGSARRAGNLIGMSHTSIARRIDTLETRLGAKVFNRLPTGYTLTQDGEELIEAALSVEATINSAKLRLTGRDKRLSGVVRVTTTDTIATYFLIPMLAQFSDTYPDIEFELMIGYRSLDLRKREADIAIRSVNKPPEHLIGHSLTPVAWSAYATPQYIAQHDFSATGNARWIGFGVRSAAPSRVKQTHLPDVPVWGSFDDVPLQIEAARNHMGIAYIPCYVGDPDQDLQRVVPA